jgi:Bacterial Ig-like domain (group 2)
VSASGGPQPESAIEFSVDEQKIGTINQAGLIEANSIGRTVITARAVGVDAYSRSFIYSQVRDRFIGVL